PTSDFGALADRTRFAPDGSKLYVVARGTNGDAGSVTKLIVIDIVVPDIGPFDSIAAFTAQQYADAFGRPATADESTAVHAALAAGQRGGDVIGPLVQAESAADPSRAALVRLYQAAFLRPPDRSGLEFWLRRF